MEENNLDAAEDVLGYRETHVVFLTNQKRFLVEYAGGEEEAKKLLSTIWSVCFVVAYLFRQGLIFLESLWMAASRPALLLLRKKMPPCSRLQL